MGLSWWGGGAAIIPLLGLETATKQCEICGEILSIASEETEEV